MKPVRKKRGWKYWVPLSSVSLLSAVFCLMWIASLVTYFEISWLIADHDYRIVFNRGLLTTGRGYSAYVPYGSAPRIRWHWKGVESSLSEIGRLLPRFNVSRYGWAVQFPAWQLSALLAIWPTVAICMYFTSRPPPGLCPACG